MPECQWNVMGFRPSSSLKELREFLLALVGEAMAVAELAWLSSKLDTRNHLTDWISTYILSR